MFKEALAASTSEAGIETFPLCKYNCLWVACRLVYLTHSFLNKILWYKVYICVFLLLAWLTEIFEYAVEREELMF